MATEQEIEETMEDMQEEQVEDAQEDQMQLSQEMQELYGAPEPEEQYNQHTFLNKAAFGTENTLKTTWLSPEECGRPDFAVRFLLQMKTIAEHYLDPLVKEINEEYRKKINDKKAEDIIKNGISKYFWDKTQNITNSGMSMKGFAMNLNVTKKLEAVRSRVRSNITNLKGGKK